MIKDGQVFKTLKIISGLLYSLTACCLISPARADETTCGIAAKSGDLQNTLLSCEPVAKAGSQMAQVLMAESLRKTDINAATEWAKKAAAKSYPPAIYFLSEYARNPSDEVALIKKAAELGLPEAQYRLAELHSYYHGYGGLPEDEKSSLLWMTKAAEGGLRKAQIYLGRHFEDRESATRDETKASFWFGRALQAQFDPLLALKLDTEVFNKPMQFLPFYPCAGSSSECQLAILGVGEIEAASADKLAALNPPSRITVYLHSPGGNLVGGLLLGEEIRKRQLNTETGGRVESFDDYGILVDSSICASSCSYAFLGGVNRNVGRPEALLFHQFASPLGISKESQTQEVIGLLNKHLDRMGVSRKTLDPALLNRPEQVGFLSQRELRQLNVTTVDLTEDLTQAELIDIGTWQLDLNGDLPKVSMTRPTDYKTGQVSLTLTSTASPDAFIFKIIVEWSEVLDQEYIASGQHDMFGQHSSKVIFCSDYDPEEAGCNENNCKNAVLSLDLPGAQWKRSSSRVQEISYLISQNQYERLLAGRPGAILLTADVSNAHREMTFCFHPYVLTEKFFKMLSLLR